MVRLPQRRSRPARWSWRFAVFTVPLIVLTAVLHRLDSLETSATLFILGLALALALLALVLGVTALLVIWARGDSGARRAIGGTVLSALILAWPVWNLTAIATLPQINDITTDGLNTPAFEAAARDRPEGTNPLEHGGRPLLQKQAAAYPEIVPFFLSYPAGDVYEAARALVEARGWRKLSTLPPEFDQPGRIEAVARTLIFGFEDDVVIRISPQAGEETRIDMRSASRYGRHDLGTNARRIYSFLNDLQRLLEAPPETEEDEEGGGLFG